MRKKICIALILFSCCTVGELAFAGDNINQDEELTAMFFSADEMVEVATRSPKPVNLVAENVTIITAEEIEAMHAHNLGEVLNRQSGIFITFDGQDFLGGAELTILGSRRHHVLLLLDGVRLNLNSGGNTLSEFIPLGIIKRIEIIKGAASSTWGSALGGVINIITKDTGRISRPKGTVHGSYGEANSSEVSADMAGKVSNVGYFIHGSTLNSDGLHLDRYSERDTVYGKMSVALPHNSKLIVSAGYSDPFYKNLNWTDVWGISDLNIYQDFTSCNTWGTVYLDTQLTSGLSLHLSVQHFENDFTADYRSLGTGLGGPEHDRIFKEDWHDEVNSFTSRIAWVGQAFSANIGFESSHSEMVYENYVGSLFGGPASSENDPEKEERRGFYANITYVRGGFSITPGLRYDYHSNSGEAVSPSLGLTYLLTEDTLLRGTIAKGFSAPYLAASSHSPDLEPENVWIYQAGIETASIPYVHLKGTIFHQKIEDAWVTTVPWTNAGTIRLNGFEIEAKTIEYHGLSLTGNLTIVTEDSMGDGTTNRENDETYTGNLILSYRNADYDFRAEFVGHYYWMNAEIKNEEPDHDDFLCDVLLAWDLSLPVLSGELYIKGHNIFNGNQYWDYEYSNPERWFEAGFVVKY